MKLKDTKRALEHAHTQVRLETLYRYQVAQKTIAPVTPPLPSSGLRQLNVGSPPLRVSVVVLTPMAESTSSFCFASKYAR